MSKVVCVVEDNKAINKLFSTLLTKSEYTVHSFGNGNDLIDWLTQNVADLFILDYLLPDMTGVEILKKIKESNTNKNAKILAVTGFATEDNVMNIKNSGFDGYLTKPVDTGLFMKTINNILS